MQNTADISLLHAINDEKWTDTRIKSFNPTFRKLYMLN